MIRSFGLLGGIFVLFFFVFGLKPGYLSLSVRRLLFFSAFCGVSYLVGPFVGRFVRRVCGTFLVVLLCGTFLREIFRGSFGGTLRYV